MNNKYIYTLLAVIFMLTACDFEVSDNGDLDGYWQLKQQDTLATGGTTDMRNSGYYWAIQVNLLEIRDVQAHQLNVLFRFEHKDSKLRLYNPIADNRNISDSLIASPVTLEPYGLQDIDETFDIIELNSDKMVLENACYRYHFRKY